MDKLIGILIFLFVSLLIVFGIIEVGVMMYQYYIEKGLSHTTSSFFSFMGLAASIILAVVAIFHTSLFEPSNK